MKSAQLVWFLLSNWRMIGKLKEEYQHWARMNEAQHKAAEHAEAIGKAFRESDNAKSAEALNHIFRNAG